MIAAMPCNDENFCIAYFSFGYCRAGLAVLCIHIENFWRFKNLGVI